MRWYGGGEEHEIWGDQWRGNRGEILLNAQQVEMACKKYEQIVLPSLLVIILKLQSYNSFRYFAISSCFIARNPSNSKMQKSRRRYQQEVSKGQCCKMA